MAMIKLGDRYVSTAQVREMCQIHSRMHDRQAVVVVFHDGSSETYALEENANPDYLDVQIELLSRRRP